MGHLLCVNLIKWNWHLRKLDLSESWKGSENKVIIHLPSSKEIPERAGSIGLQVPSAALTNQHGGSEFSTRAFHTQCLGFHLGCDPQTVDLHSPIQQHKYWCLIFCLFVFSGHLESLLEWRSLVWTEARLSFSGNVDDFSWLHLDQFHWEKASLGSPLLTISLGLCPWVQVRFVCKFENLLMILLSFLQGGNSFY